MTRISTIRLSLLSFILFLTFTTPALAQTTTIRVDPTTTYQIMSGWEATAQAGQDSFQQQFPYYKDALFDMAVDYGLNRLRIEVFSGIENPIDHYLIDFINTADPAANESNWVNVYGNQIVNDNSDPNATNLSGFQFSSIDRQMDMVALPLKQRLQAQGEDLLLNFCYVDFKDTSSLHYGNPAEYAEFVLAIYQHMQARYGFTPNYWEMILEPDNSTGGVWTADRIGRAMYQTATVLHAHGFSPRLIAPSVSSMDKYASFITGLKTGIKNQGGLTDSQLNQFLTDYVDAFSYHRYHVYVDTSIMQQTVISQAQPYGINSSMLEHIASDFQDLHKDVKYIYNDAWQQYSLTWPIITGTINDNGGKYFLVDATNTTNPTINPGYRTKIFRQYFKYIRSGAVHIQSIVNGVNESVAHYYALDPISFINPDGTYVVSIFGQQPTTYPAPVSITNLPAGTYGITYATSSVFNQNLPDQTLQTGQAVNFTITSSGVWTVYGKTPANPAPPSPSPTPTFAPVDFNQDGHIDFLDLVSLLTNFGHPGATDLNQSGQTDIFDFTTLLTSF